jgi:DNA-binding transcriptional ArsR family regulator
MTNESLTRLRRTSQFLKVLGNVYRLQIVSLLLSGEKNVSELNKQVKVSQPALSQHLAKLKKENIVISRRQQRQIFYALNNPMLPEILRVTEEVMAAAGEVAKKPKLAKRA